MSKLLRGVMLTLIVLLATSAYAQQGPQGRWWRTPRVSQQLNLTQGEIQQLERTWNASREKMIKLKGQVETEQFRLQTLLEKRQLDENAVRKQNRKLEEARSQLADERTSFVVQVRKIIGHDRFQQLLGMRQ
jgi:Spy/CpxP family protein refolding chaperone